jgi:hypothetical protein
MKYSKPCKKTTTNLRRLERIKGKYLISKKFSIFWDQYLSVAIDYHNDIRLANADAATNMYIATNKFHSVYIDSVNVVDFLKNNEIKNCDAKVCVSLFESYVKRFNEGIYLHLMGEKHSVFFCYGSPSAPPPDGAVQEPTDVFAFAEKGSVCDGVLAFARRGSDDGTPDIGHITITPDQILWGKDYENAAAMNECWSIIFNLMLYIDAFPECVIEGGPRSTLTMHVDRRRSTVVTESNAIKETYARGTTSPHFRRGHFRFLQSERFKGKRYQTVYVKPSMVKGTAETVVEC